MSARLPPLPGLVHMRQRWLSKKYPRVPGWGCAGHPPTGTGAYSKKPDQVVLDRTPNPHIGFGFGPHNCLGAPHARLVIRTLLKMLCQKVQAIELLSCVPRIEKETSYTRQVGYDLAMVRFS